MEHTHSFVSIKNVFWLKNASVYKTSSRARTWYLWYSRDCVPCLPGRRLLVLASDGNLSFYELGSMNPRGAVSLQATKALSCNTLVRNYSIIVCSQFDCSKPTA